MLLGYNYLLAQKNTFFIEEKWIVPPSACRTKDGVVDFIPKGGTPPYHIYRKNSQLGTLDTVLLPISNVDYQTPFNLVFFDSAPNPATLEMIFSQNAAKAGKMVTDNSRVFCNQKKGSPNSYYLILDSLKNLTYPLFIYVNDTVIEVEKPTKTSLNIKVDLLTDMDKTISIIDSHPCSITYHYPLGYGNTEKFYDTKLSLTPDTIKLRSNQIPDTEIALNIDYHRSKGNPIYLYRGLQIQWYKDDTKISNPTKYKLPITALENAKYKVHLIDMYNCQYEAYTYVVVEDSLNSPSAPKLPAYLPTAFSPNNDGVNDYFTVFSGTEVSRIEHMTIYDRWGGQLFEVLDIEPSDELLGWNGSHRGTDLPQGNYTYDIVLILKDGTKKAIKGEVMLLR